MNPGELIVTCLRKFGEIVAPLIESPESREKKSAEAEKIRADAAAVRLGAFADAAKRLSEARKIDIETVSIAVDVLKKAGHTDAEISEMITKKTDVLIGVVQDISTIKSLSQNGIIQSMLVKPHEKK
jgi:hypothetical protein